MADVMEFPNTWEEYEKIYGFNDIDQVYTNGSRLIPSFRVKQWLDHIADRKTEPQTSKIIEAYSKGFEDGAEAVKAIPQMGVSYSDHTDYDEPKTYVTWTEPQTERSE